MSGRIKVFYPEVEGYLREAGVSEKEINRMKFTALKQGVLDIIARVKDAVSSEDFAKVKDFTSYSPAGDGYGRDNQFIAFGQLTGEEDDLDIVDVCRLLTQLKKSL